VTTTRFLTLAEASRRLDVREETLARWIRTGRFPAYKTPGGRYRIAEVDLTLALEPARRRDRDGEERGR
jgi:excisionase family DNA binding protein